jgi:phosphoglucosamine mutase
LSRNYFGTDGVRGRVGEPPMTVEFALRLASAAAQTLAPEGGTALVGKDTRLSGYMFEAALEAGFVAAGVDVSLIGPLPTPGIAYLTQRFGCSFGVVIKFFDANGSKLPDELEARIESYLGGEALTQESERLGRATRVDKSRVIYQEFCASTLPRGTNLSGLKVVIDCANGAAYKVAPRVLSDLGAEIIPIGCSPNGRNINLRCGSTEPALLQATVAALGADAGIALDGDGDRLVMVDHLGRLVDGDQLLYIIAVDRRELGELSGPVVGTVMSNLGLEHALGKLGVPFLRAKVGDRYVLAMLKEHGGVLGGETSGHLLCLDRTTTGDGLVSALQVLAAMKRSGRTLAELSSGMPSYPQVMINVRVSERADPMESAAVRSAVQRLEQSLGDTGRVVLRASGTEPVIRVMVEGRDHAAVTRHAEDLAEVVRSTL